MIEVKKTPTGKFSFVVDDFTRKYLFLTVEQYIRQAPFVGQINTLDTLKLHMLNSTVREFRDRQNWSPSPNGRKRFTLKRTEALALIAVISRYELIELDNLKSELLKAL